MDEEPPVSVATPAQREMVRRLLTRELAGSQDPAAWPAAAERACQKLCGPLAKLVTAIGCQAIVARALHLARAEFPFLEGVRAGTFLETCFEGLGDRSQGVDPAHVRDGLVAVLANAIGLLATFIGDDLTLRLVHDVWPDAPLEEAASSTRETTT